MSDRRSVRILVSAFCAVVSLAASDLSHASGMPDWAHYSDRETTDWPSLRDLDIRCPDAEGVAELERQAYGYVVCLDRADLTIRSDGILIERRVLAHLYVSATGVRESGNDFVAVRPTLEKIRILAAYAAEPSGANLAPVTADSIQFVGNESFDIFSDAETVVVPYPSLAPGMVSVLVYEKEIDTRRWPLPWSFIYNAVRNVPAVKLAVQATWEAGVSPPACADSVSGGACGSDLEERTIRCTLLDIPPMPSDPDVASWPDVIPVITIGEAVSWRELASAEARLVEESVATFSGSHPAMTGNGDRETLASIYRFVADEIRYVAFESGVGAVKPRPARLTLDRGYGDCKDKVALFVSLARAAGLDAYPALVATNRYDPNSLVLPGWRWFDHMVACVAGIDPEPICLELTSPYAQAGTLPTGLAGAVKLDLLPEREGELEPSQLDQPSYVWEIESRGTTRVECDGSLRESVRVSFEGGLALWFRAKISSMPRDDRERWFIDFYEDVTGVEASAQFQVEGMESSASRLTLVSEVRHEATSDPLGWRYFGDADAWLTYYLRGLETSNEHHPFKLVGLRVLSSNEYELCDSMAATPEGIELALAADYGRFERWYDRDGQKVSVDSTLEIPARQITPGELERYRRFIAALVDSTTIRFGLEGRDE